MSDDPVFGEENVSSGEDHETNEYGKLKEVKSSNPNRLTIKHVNINSLRNKFEMLQTIIINKVDILPTSETKLDNSFPSNQFFLDSFSSR